MLRLLAYILCLSAAAGAFAQIDVRGVVVDITDGEPLAGASVIVKGADRKIIKFASTKADGEFSLQVRSTEGCRLEVSMMGFSRQSLALDSIALPVTVGMRPGATLLREVTVKADRIREQGDTLTYNVGSFAQSQDRSIGDVLKRMPGIDVAESGKIQYQGEDINKFYIEGSDMLGGKYGLATNGISHEDVGAVEVMENHQPMQVLSGISFSDKAAINLKLKNKAKATWSLHGDAGGGWSWQPEGAVWDGEFFAMAVMPGFQNLTTFRTNNTGEDLSASKTDFFALRRGTDLSRYVSVALPAVPSLDRKRTYFNRSFLVSTNSLWKFGSGEFKANVDYSFNRVTAQATNTTTYFLEGGNRVVTEDRDGTEHTHSLGARFIYEFNGKTTFVNNTLKTDIGWNDIRLHTDGSIVSGQKADLPEYYVGNSLKLIRRFKGRHLVTLESSNEWESLPQTLDLDTDGRSLRQNVGDRSFHTRESVSYAFTLKGLTVSLEGGVKGYWRSMNSSLPELPAEVPGLTTNVVHTNSFTVYATPKLEYWVRRVDIVLSMPLSYAHYSFDKAIANHDEGYLSPSLSFNWKPNNRIACALRGGVGRSPMDLSLVYPGLIMTDYRTLKTGVDNFYSSTSRHISASFQYKHTRRGLFANGTVMQSWSHLPYTLSQQLYGDYAVYSYADADNDSNSLMAMGNVGKTLDFMQGSCNLNASYSRGKSRLMSQLQSVESVSSGWSLGGKINGSAGSRFSFGYAIRYSDSRLAMNGVPSPWLSSLTNELDLNYSFHSKWQWRVGGEHYRNEVAEGSYKNVVMIDTKLIYKPTKRIEIGASLNNILDRRRYGYTTYSQLSSFESSRMLRGRQFLISITLRK